MSWNDTKMKEENKVIFHIVYECGFEVSSRFGNFLLKSIKKHTRTCFLLFLQKAVLELNPGLLAY